MRVTGEFQDLRHRINELQSAMTTMQAIREQFVGHKIFEMSQEILDTALTFSPECLAAILHDVGNKIIQAESVCVHKGVNAPQPETISPKPKPLASSVPLN